jgi:hypothetical protein
LLCSVQIPLFSKITCLIHCKGNGEGNNGHNDQDTGKAWGLKVSAVLAVPMFSHLEVGGTGYVDTNYHICMC